MAFSTLRRLPAVLMLLVMGECLVLPGPSSHAETAGSVKADIRDIAQENEQLRRKLNQPTNLDKGIDSNTPLSDALEFLSDKYDVKLHLDEKAFAAHGLPKVAEQPVQLPKMVGLRLQTVLDWLLGEIALDNGMRAGVRVRDGKIEVVPIEPSEPGEGWVSPKRRQRLLRPMAWDRDIPGDMPFAKVLEMVGSHYGEMFIFDDKAFTALGGVSPRDAKMEAMRLKGERKMLMEVLEVLMQQVSTQELLASYRVKPDGIEITAVKRGSPEMKGVFQSLDGVRARQEADRKIADYSRKLEKVPAKEIGIEANTPLADALEFVCDQLDLAMIIDSRAFEAVGIQKVEETNVQLPPKKGQKGAAILQALLDPIQADDWVASYIVREEFIELTVIHKHIRDKKPLTREQLDHFWGDMAGRNWIQPVQAARTLAVFPEQSVGLLRERVKAAVPLDPKQVAEARRWVKALDSAEFTVREKASAELEKLGKAAVPALRDELQAKPPVEMRLRVEQLLEKIDSPVSAEQLRAVRAIHLLAEIGTPEAERLLETLAKGAPGAAVTEMAKAALQRLNN